MAQHKQQFSSSPKRKKALIKGSSKTHFDSLTNNRKRTKTTYNHSKTTHLQQMLNVQKVILNKDETKESLRSSRKHHHNVVTSSKMYTVRQPGTKIIEIYEPESVTATHNNGS